MIEKDRDELIREEVEWCHDAVGRVSRTFSLTVAELEEPMTDYICVGYLLCRIADTVEDAAHIPPPVKRRLLETYREAIDPDGTATPEEFRRQAAEWAPEDPDDDWAVVARAPRVIRAFRGFDAGTRDAMRPPVLEMIDGMAMFVDRYAEEGGLRIQTFDELEEYCWYVAGTVGTLVTNLLSQEAPPETREALEDNARSFALLLQIVNIAKDVDDDYRTEDNVYLPEGLLADHGLDPDDIDEEDGDAFAPVVRAVVSRSEEYLDGAEAWLEAMPEVRGNTLSAWAVPFLLAIATIRELKSRPEDVIAEGELKIDREEVLELLDRFHTGEPSVPRLRETMRERPLQER